MKNKDAIEISFFFLQTTTKLISMIGIGIVYPGENISLERIFRKVKEIDFLSPIESSSYIL